MGILKNIALATAGVVVAGGATLVAVPELRNKAMDKIAEQSNQYQQVVNENEELRTENEEKEQTITRINAEIETERANVRNIQLSLNTANANLAQANEDKATLQTQLNTANTEKTVLQTRLDTVTAEKNQLTTDLATANTDKANLQTRLDAKITELENIQTQLTAKETEITTLTARITALTAVTAELQAELTELNTLKLGKYVWSYQLQNGDYEDIYIEVLENGVAKYYIDAENFVLCTYTVEDDKINVTFEEDNQEMQIQFTITSPTTFETNDLGEYMQFVYCTDELLDVLETRQTAQADKQTMQTNIQNMSAELANIQSQLEFANSEVTRIQSELDAKNVEYAALQAEVVAKTETILNLQTEIETKQVTITELNATIAELNTNKQTLQERITELEARVETLEENQNDFVLNESRNYVLQFFFTRISSGNTLIFDLESGAFNEYKNISLSAGARRALFLKPEESGFNLSRLFIEKFKTPTITSESLGIITTGEKISYDFVNDFTTRGYDCEKTIEFVDINGDPIDANFYVNFNGDCYYRIVEEDIEYYTAEDVPQFEEFSSQFANAAKSIYLRIEVIPKYTSGMFIGRKVANGSKIFYIDNLTPNEDKLNEFLFVENDMTHIAVITSVNSIEIDGVEYKRFIDVIDEYELINVINDGLNVRLVNNIELTTQLTINNNCTIDLNGYELYNTTDVWDDSAGVKSWSLISAQGGEIYIFSDDEIGKIIAKENDCYAIDVRNGANLIVENVGCIGNIHAIYVFEGNLTVNSGNYCVQQKFSNERPDEYVLNCYDANYRNGTASIEVKSGVFLGFNPADCYAEGEHTSFIIENAKVKSYNNVYVVSNKDIDLDLYIVEDSVFIGLTDFGKALDELGVLEIVEIPEGVTTIDCRLGRDSNIITLKIPSTVIDLENIQFCFDSCKKLENIIIDENNQMYTSVDNIVYTKDMSAVVYSPRNNSTKNVVIPDGVTLIYEDAFSSNKNVESIVLPDTVTFIGFYAFDDCPSLKTLIIKSVEPPFLPSKLFVFTCIEDIYVPAESVEAYKTAPFWDDYANIIQAIPDVE